MSNTLDSIIKRRKKDSQTSNSNSTSKSGLKPQPKEETSSWNMRIVVIIVVVVIIIIGLVWWFLYKPTAKSQTSILDEMKNAQVGDSNRCSSDVPGTISLDTFRKYNSRFSRNYSATDVDDF